MDGYVLIHELDAAAALRLEKAVEYIRALTREDRFMKVTVHELSQPGGRIILGQSSVGSTDEIELSPRLFRSYRLNPNEPMPVARKFSNLVYTVAHEVGHARDFRKHSMAVWEFGRCRLPGITDGREMFAECFSEWFLSRGRTDVAEARWYAARHGWRTDF